MSRDRHLTENIGTTSAAYSASPAEVEQEGSRKRVLLAGLYHETNALLSGRTTLEDFETKRGEEVLRAEGGDPLFGGRWWSAVFGTRASS